MTDATPLTSVSPGNSNSSDVKIDWSYSGKPDPLLGTGAVRGERILAHSFAFILMVLILLRDRLQQPHPLSGLRLLVLAFFAYDIAGGTVANMLNSCKRYYHSEHKDDEGTGAWLVKNARVFTLIHVHPILAAWWLKGSVWNAFIWYLVLQVAVSAVLCMPLYLRRPFATGITIVALLGNQYISGIGDGLEWFIPCLFIKMVMGHAVREEPYRPVE